MAKIRILTKLIEPHEIPGRTVKAIVRVWSYGGILYVFTDGTHSIPYTSGYQWDMFIGTAECDLRPISPENKKDLIDAGVIDESCIEEYNAEVAAEKERMDEICAAKERERYLELKTKFEKDANAGKTV
jgi:hypothetical protein